MHRGNPTATASHSGQLVSPEDLLRRLGVETAHEIDLEAIAQFCGATIVYERLRGCEARIIGHGNRAIITVNAESHEYRRRFSAGHELGHWMRDRGTVSFACSDRLFKSEWATSNPERRANRYAAELLLPTVMFSQDARNREITFATVHDLSDRYRTSHTATAIRLVELGPFPSLLICTRRERRWAWFTRSADLPSALWPRDQPGPGTLAYDLLRGSQVAIGPADVSADGWFDLEEAERYVVREDAVRIADDLVLSLLWWQDERQLVSLSDLE